MSTYKEQLLEAKLNRQSTHLAEALKLKNDALEVLRHVKCALPIFVLEPDVLKAVKSFVEVYKHVNKQAIDTGTRNSELVKQVLELTKEVQALRPIPPKFRVDQVVAWGHRFCKIVDRQLNSITPSKWEYRLLPNVGWVFEDDIRALEDSEKC